MTGNQSTSRGRSRSPFIRRTGVTAFIAALALVFASCSGGNSRRDGPPTFGPNSSVVANPLVVAANGADVTTVTVTLLDSNDNPIQGAMVELAATGTGNIITQPAVASDANGVVTGTVASTVAETKVISATAALPGGSPVTLGDMPSVEFVTCNFSATLSTVTASPAIVAADGVQTATIIVLVKDDQDQPVAGAPVSIGVTGTNNVLNPAGVLTTDASGEAMATLASTTAEVKTISATIDPGGPCETQVANTAQVEFINCIFSATLTTITANPATGVFANGVDSSTITVTVKDDNDQPVAGAPVLVAASGAMNVLTPTGPVVTNATGEAVVTLTSTRAEAKTISATIDPGGPCETQVANTATVTFIGGPCPSPNPPHSTVTAMPGTLLADGVAASTITVILRDEFDNPIAGADVDLSVTGSQNVLSAATITTNAAGQATATLASTLAETKVVTATVVAAAGCPNLPITQSQMATVTFVADPSTATVTVTANPTSFQVGGSTTITTLVADANGNPISGATVTHSASGTGNTFTPSTPLVTNAAGLVMASYSTTETGMKTVTATASVPCPNCPVSPLIVSGSTTVNVTVPATALICTLAASPDPVQVPGPTTITVTVIDDLGSPVAGAMVTVSASGSNNTFNPASPLTTDANGVATTSLTSTTAEPKTITANASFGTLVPCSDTLLVTFTPGCVDPAPPSSVLTADPTTGVLANGIASATLTTLVRDQFSNPIPGATVQLSSGSGTTITPATGQTDANGIFTASITSTEVGVKTVTAVATHPDPACGPAVTLTSTATVEFVPVVPPISSCTATIGGNEESEHPSLSADGNTVAFTSEATNLLGTESGSSSSNGDEEAVYVCDRQTGAIELVSLDNDGNPIQEEAEHPSISADGNLVAFEAEGPVAVPNGPPPGIPGGPPCGIPGGPPSECEGIYVRDRAAATTERVDVDSNGNFANDESHDPSMAGLGQFVAFSSEASNLVTGDTNGEEDIFVHDRVTGVTTRVSVSSSGAEANDDSRHPSISADGRFIAFESKATNLVSGDTNGRWDIFVHDTMTGTTVRASVSTSGAQSVKDSHRPSLSADGTAVAFHSKAGNLVSGDTNNKKDVFVHTLASGTTVRVSVGSGGTQGNGTSKNASISGDGSRVAFESSATNLVAGDTNGEEDVFVADLVAGTLVRVSVAANGTQGNEESEDPSIAANGTAVAFTSEADNLVPGDNNDEEDIFIAGVN